jgi:hypothetical protein
MDWRSCVLVRRAHGTHICPFALLFLIALPFLFALLFPFSRPFLLARLETLCEHRVARTTTALVFPACILAGRPFVVMESILPPIQ